MIRLIIVKYWVPKIIVIVKHLIVYDSLQLEASLNVVIQINTIRYIRTYAISTYPTID